MTEKKNEKKSTISDQAVYSKTGKNWNAWFTLLDKSGAKKMSHKQIVGYLKQYEQVNGWWQQMITVAFEQSRGLREKHENPAGFQISRSKTFSVKIALLYQSWLDSKKRSQWLSDPDITIRKANKDKNIRIAWADNLTLVEAQFYPKDFEKTQLVVQHSRLQDASTAEQMKDYWGHQLKNLEKFLTAK
jgi:uncharacterized protein YndB with AHSA1/START domain